jgi:hypothetical protein
MTFLPFFVVFNVFMMLYPPSDKPLPMPYENNDLTNTKEEK